MASRVSGATTMLGLEVKLERYLNNALIVITPETGGGNLSKVRTVYVKHVVHTEICVIEDIESLKPQFQIEVFFELRPLNKRSIRGPVTRAVNRGQAQVADRTCGRICKEGRVGASVRSDQTRVD